MRRHDTSRLTAIEFLRDCPPAELRRISSSTTTLTVPAGTELTREGRAGYEFFLISSGEAVVERDGRQLAVLGAGDHFGELALLGQGARNATVRTRTDVEVLVIQSTDFPVLLEEAPSFTARLLRSVATRLAEQDAARAAS